jgi:hypothetical protein
MQNRAPEMKDWFGDTAMRELASIYRSDLTLLISDAEADLLTGTLGIPTRLLHVTPFLLNEDQLSLSPSAPGFEQRKGFITIGNFRHPPNADSIRFLADTLWPQLRVRCPEAVLDIYGADLTPAMRNLHRPENGFRIHGRADDAVQTLSEARVCLAPLRFGAGCKGKLLDAMQAGTPSVTTTVGAEGMQGPFAWPGEVADDPERIVQAAAELVQDEARWTAAQKKAAPLLRGRFDRRQHGPALMQRITDLLTEVPDTSPDQLTGALLRHHQHRSTEYMSRWIEAKQTLRQHPDPTG